MKIGAEMNRGQRVGSADWVSDQAQGEEGLGGSVFQAPDLESAGYLRGSDPPVLGISAQVPGG